MAPQLCQSSRKALRVSALSLSTGVFAPAAPTLPDANPVGLSILAVAGFLLAAGATVFYWWAKRTQVPRVPRDAGETEFDSGALTRYFGHLSRFVNDILFIMDSHGRILEANDRAVETYGYSREELLGMNIGELRHPIERHAMVRQWNETEERGSLRFETLHVKRDGASAPVEVSSRIVRLEGKTLRLSIIRDVTERKAMDDKLRRTLRTLEASESRFRQWVEHAPEGIIVESGFLIRYLNPVAVRLFGAQSADELLGRDVSELVQPDQREASKARSEMVAQGHTVPMAERTFVRLDGELLPTELSAAPIEYDGRPASLVFFRDISERKRNEAEKSALEAQLSQAQRLESIGRLAGGVAHDFNNHLTVINGYCDMLLAQSGLGDDIREPLEEIRAAGQRAGALTLQLLALSRKQIIEPKHISLNEAVSEAGKMIRRLIGEDIEMATRLDPSGPVVLADCGQVNQILLNLAVNARDAMPHGGTLAIETGVIQVDSHYAAHHPEAREGTFATLTMTDSGVGMSREVVEHIFEPFFTTKKPGAGTGLGLATIYGIVRQGGGWIRVYSEPGHGAVFQIYLPLVEAEAEKPVVKTSGDQDEFRGTETVLVVEDQAEVRRLTIAALRQKGYRLLEARDGAEALDVCARWPEAVDLLLTDVVMPGMNGCELAARVLKSRPGTRVLYTSGYTEDAIGTGGYIELNAAYLPKPFTAAQLAAKVRQVLGTKALPA